MTMTQTDNFGELVLEKRIVAALKEMGFEEPSPIQQQAIPLLLEGKDIILYRLSVRGNPIFLRQNTDNLRR